ncbi:small integral membrane protein 20 isoform X1 [Strigops habroptila]|uniref:small integral membrane protein 20 isoform X1 n=1 Tax=Strigops habroptila TaxID=2489341 RepID=UPI0011CF549F|nr:small integral membrane protein 20 isoform X1 [Strigops habroptila]
MAGLYRTVGVFGGFVAVVAAAFYPIYFRPLLMPEEYKKEQSVNRAGIVQEDIQPAEKPAISSRGKPNRINAMSLLRIPVKSLVQDLLSRKVVKC